MSTARPNLLSVYKRCRARRTLTTVPLYRPDPLVLIPRGKAELRQAVEKLEGETRFLRQNAATSDKLRLTRETTADVPEYSEEELQTFYEQVKTSLPPSLQPQPDALALPAPREPIPKNERKEIIRALLARLETLQLPAPTPGSSAVPVAVVGKGWRAAQRARAFALVEGITPDTHETTPPDIPTGLVSKTEFRALFDDSLAARDPAAAAHVLSRARAHGVPIDTEVEALLAGFAANGDLLGVARTLKETEERTGVPAPREYLAAVVNAHLARGDAHAAVRALHGFEAEHLILPEGTYTAVLDALLPSSPVLRQADKALALDLFHHMRLIAHPTPSVAAYETIIRACADPKDPQPEMAVDLFTQLVSEDGQRPRGETYSVLIRALARVKAYYFHAFRILRQMLEVHQSLLPSVPAGQGTGYEPTTQTFNALLEGTKRAGDLGRARWILAEMAKVAAFAGPDVPGMMPSEETAVGVFHTYAAYKPVIGRGDVKLAEAKSEPEATVTQEDVAQDEETAQEPAAASETEPPAPRELSLMDIGSPDFVPPYQPQTSYEVFSEATQLFNLIINDITHAHGIFSHVRPTARLVNAYLSVGLAHAPLDKAVQMQLQLWNDTRLVPLGVRPNGWTYLFALERCAAARGKMERRFVEDGLERVWLGYLRCVKREEEALAKMQGPETERYALDVGLGPREVERCWVAVIRAFALVENTSRALDILGEFRDRYPPDAIIQAFRPAPRFANKIRFSSPHRTLEDDIPPHVLFHDLEILHHRFVRDGNLQGVGKIKWVTLGYQLALEKRKSMRLAESKHSGAGNKVGPVETPSVGDGFARV